MACIYNRVDVALEELNRQLEEESRGSAFHELGGDEEVRFSVNNFEGEFRFLTMFLDSIREWSDADKIFPNLGSLVTEIEASIEKLGNELSLNTNHKKFSVVKLPLKSLRGRGSNLIEFFDSLNPVLLPLKRQISEACDSLVSHSFKCHSPMHDFDRWKKFAQLVESKLDFLGGKAYPNDALMKLVYAFKEKLRLVICFLLRLADSFPNNGDLENVMIHVGSVVINAALLICQFWNRASLLEKKSDVTLTLLDLQKNIDFATPEFAEMYLRLLKNFQTNTDNQTLKPVDMFVEHLFSFSVDNIKCWADSTILNALHTNLISLITSAFNIPEEHAVHVHRFDADIKIVVTGLASLLNLPHQKSETGSVVLTLLAKMLLIKLEIFLREQLTTQDILSIEEQPNVFNQGIQYQYLVWEKELLETEIVDSLEGSTENLKQILAFLEELVSVVRTLNHSCVAKEMQRKKARNLLLKLLLKVMLFKAESLLMKLLDNNESLMVFANDQTEILQAQLKFLTIFMENQSEVGIEDVKRSLAHVDAVAGGIISLCYSFPTNKITEEMINHTSHLLATLLDEIKLIMVELKDIYLHVPRSSFPKTIGMGFIDSLLRKLRELPDHKADAIASSNHQIEQISQDLEFFRSFLSDFLNQDIKIQEVKDLVPRVVTVAYEAEYLIDSIVLGNDAEWLHHLWFYHFFEEIRPIKMQVKKLNEEKAYGVKSHNIVQTSRQMKPKDTPSIAEAMVSLNDEEDVIINRLIGGFLPRDTISIVGMPGIGKTTLARKVYNNPRVRYHFHIRAWCCVSEVYKKRELLLDIIGHIIAPTDNILEMTDEDLDLKLYQLLKQNRYLIVMDDLWNSGAWDDLGRSFPDDGNGSRILITSRLHDVAMIAKVNTDPHSLRLLTDAESWDLLRIKIFHDECCPEDLVETGKQIARRCKGLPLSIVAIAGLLGRTERQQDWWKEIAENLSLRIVDDPQNQCMDILKLSYKHLPYYLKSCFLYFGAFQEDENIPIRKLIRLWIAEDFIQENESKSLEDVAEDYLDELIGRSLVIVAQRSSMGGVKTCRVHDMLQTLCQSVAQEENFLRLITGFDLPDESFDGLDYGVDLDYSNPVDSMRYEDHRLCIRSKRKHFAKSSPSGTPVRSLLFFATSDTYPRCPYDILFIPHNFKFIKVLNLECINMGSSFPDAAKLLVNLRYLAVSGDFDYVPSSLANLWNLETFVVKGLKGKVQLPDTFWSMVRLRHVHVSGHAVFGLLDENLGSSSQLGNLVTLSSPVLLYGEKTAKILRQFPNLQTLRCIFWESWDNSENCNQFPSLDILTQLESVKVSYYGRVLHPGQFSFPVNLKKLTLSNFRLPWNHISVIGGLPNLKVLKLLSRAFEGERWDMVDGEFSKLKFLKLDTLNIVEWNASSDHLPNLQQLVLRSCKQLEEVPGSIGEIPTLEIIEVQWCGGSAEESVRRIGEEADEKLKVFINLSQSDFRSSS